MAFQGNGAENGGPGASNAAGRMGGPNGGNGMPMPTFANHPISHPYMVSMAKALQTGLTPTTGVGMMGGVGSSPYTSREFSTDQWGNPRYGVYDASGQQVGGQTNAATGYNMGANSPYYATPQGMGIRGPNTAIGPK